MTIVKILSDNSSLTDSQQKQLLALHYKFLNYQRMVLKVDHAVPDVSIAAVFAGNQCAVAFDDEEKVIGYCFYRGAGNQIGLRCMFVSEAYRRKYVMTNLLSAISESRKHESISASVFENNYLGVQLFKALGFVDEERNGWLDFKLKVKAGVRASSTLQSA
jgi:ribosomal protein S18 acetylase RimI-like enzyme